MTKDKQSKNATVIETSTAPSKPEAAKRFRRLLYTIPALSVFTIAAIFFWGFTTETSRPATIAATIDGSAFIFELADTDARRVRGLSYRENLGSRTAMLFIYDESGFPGIWMKAMNFPIDIAWLDENQRIVHLEQSVSPDSYPETFFSPVPARYVLETNAGLLQSSSSVNFSRLNKAPK